MIIGHQTQWQFLKKSVQLGKISHAFLFYGPQKLGKKTLAFELAKLLNCQNPDFKKRPCQRCSVCRDIEKRILPDLIFISPTKKEIPIEQIRELNWRMALKPYSAPWKLVILDEAHCLGKSAQNCFLKTLEEPKGKSIFILITEYPARLLPTILSRIQKMRFSPVPFLEIENYLKEKKVAAETCQKIMRYCEGRPGMALDFLAEPSKLEKYEEKIKEIKKLCQADLNFRFQYAKDLSEKPLRELNQTFQIWLQHFHQLFLSKAGADQGPTLMSPLRLKKILETIEKIQILINFTNTNTRLALENLMLQL